MRVKTGDNVVIISGKDKGSQGKIIAAKPSKNKVIVEGLNMVKKHVKQSEQHPDGGIIEFEAPIDASKVMIVDPKTGERTRVGYKFVDGKKVRFAKKSGEVLK